MLIDAVEHVNQLFKKETGRDIRLVSELRRDASREIRDEAVIALRTHAISGIRSVGVNVAHPDPKRKQRVEIECAEADSRRARVVEVWIGAKVSVHALRKWRKSLHALRPSEKRRRSSDHEIESRKSATRDFIEQSAQRVQSLLAHIRTNSLKRFDFVEHNDQSRETAIADHRQKSGEHLQCAVVIDVALDVRTTLDRRCHIRLP